MNFWTIIIFFKSKIRILDLKKTITKEFCVLIIGLARSYFNNYVSEYNSIFMLKVTEDIKFFQTIWSKFVIVLKVFIFLVTFNLKMELHSETSLLK